MASLLKKLDKLYAGCNTRLTPQGNCVIFSDMHRSDGSTSDFFYHNSHIYLAALRHYYQYHYTLVELGDGDELWKNKRIEVIKDIYREIFETIDNFRDRQQYYEFAGNHDISKLDRSYGSFYRTAVYESMKFVYGGVEFFLLHGHQADFFDSTIWKVMRWVNYYPARILSKLGTAELTGPAKIYYKRNFIEKALIKFAQRNKTHVVCGHTHKPTLSPWDRYFNTGSSLHPNGITGIEFVGGEIKLVHWHETVVGSKVTVAREILSSVTIDEIRSFEQ